MGNLPQVAASSPAKQNAPNRVAPTTPITPRILLLLASTCTEAKNFSMRNILIKSKQIELKDVGFTTTTMMQIPQSQYHYVPTPGDAPFIKNLLFVKSSHTCTISMIKIQVTIYIFKK
jgi:hypothetical protein